MACDDGNVERGFCSAFQIANGDVCPGGQYCHKSGVHDQTKRDIAAQQLNCHQHQLPDLVVGGKALTYPRPGPCTPSFSTEFAQWCEAAFLQPTACALSPAFSTIGGCRRNFPDSTARRKSKSNVPFPFPADWLMLASDSGNRRAGC